MHLSFFRLLALAATLMLGMLAMVAMPPLAEAAAKTPPGLVKGQVLVQPRAGMSEAALNRLLQKHGGRTVSTIRGIDVRVIRVPVQAEERVAKALSNHPQIRFAEVDRLVPMSSVTPNDPHLGNQWHLPAIYAPQAWAVAKGKGVVVAVLDTGVDSSHPDLSGKVLKGYNSEDGSSNTADINGHGTQVAGIIGATTDNATGVASVGWDAQILPVRVSNRSDGLASWSSLARGLTWAADNNASVANISYDVNYGSSVESAAQYMRSRGGMVVVSAGNSGGEIDYPLSDNMLAVSATTSSGTKASWSSYGDYVDLAAPGANIVTTRNGGGYGGFSGTSASSPVMAGVVALVRSANPNLKPSQVDQILFDTAIHPKGLDKDKLYGHGIVNANGAATEARRLVSSDTTPPKVAITSPGDAAQVQGDVAVDVSATDASGIQSVTFYVNGSRVASTNVSPYAFAWDSTTVSDGEVRLMAEALDLNNNRATHEVRVDVKNAVEEAPGADDTIPLSVSVTSPRDGQNVSGVVGLSASAASGYPINMLKLLVDGKLMCAGSGTSLSCNWNTRKFKGASASITATAVDDGGREVSHSITVYLGGGSTEEGGDSTDGGGTKTNNGKGNNR